MSIPKLWWIDDSDLSIVQSKLKSVKEKQLSSWNWISWREKDFDNANEAFLSITREIGIPSIFENGKAIICWGLPSFHAKLSKEITNISDGVILILITKVVKNISLYKTICELKESEDKLYRIDEQQENNKENNINFIAKRAAAFGLKIDDVCCQIILDFCGFNMDFITNEIKKLRYYCEDGNVTPFAISQVCAANGDANILILSRLIFSKKIPEVHELIERLLKRDNPLQILGFLCSWVQGMMIISGNESNINLLKEDVSEMKKILTEENSTKVVPIYPNFGRLYHISKEFSNSNFSLEWPMNVFKECMRLQIICRMFYNDIDKILKEFHYFIERIFSISNESKIIEPPPII